MSATQPDAAASKPFDAAMMPPFSPVYALCYAAIDFHFPDIYERDGVALRLLIRRQMMLHAVDYALRHCCATRVR